MKILGYDYRVVFDDLELGEMGALIHQSQVIKVTQGQVRQQLESTLLHEIIEALNYHLGLDLLHSTIMALESGLYQALTGSGIDLAPLIEQIEK